MRQRVVIKLGGSSLNNPATLSELAQTVRGYRKRGYDVIVVHGGGPAINQELTRRGITWQFINGQRQTTPQMMDVIEHVLGNEVNSKIVEQLKQSDLPAYGLSGSKDEIVFCSQSSVELICVGKVEHVETFKIEKALIDGMIPVVAPTGFGDEGMKFNVNADFAAAKIAVALKAKKLVYLTDQNGILDENKNLVRVATPRTIQNMIDTDVISGGMYAKVQAMMAALEAGVDKVHVLNAAVASQIHGRYKIGTRLMEKHNNHGRERLHERAS